MPFSDTYVCNGDDTCQGGVCTPGTGLPCDDGSVCTTDTCDSVLGCSNTPLPNGTSCADGTICNGNETCQAGLCAAGTALNCDDANICTSDSCDAVLGCGNVPVLNGTTCADASVCNGTEICQSGVCTPGTGLNCNDSNVCTSDGCDALFGCTATPVVNGTSCSDGNVCNGSETCQAGTCTPGTGLPCDDTNVCTTDTCDPVFGCSSNAVLNGTSCADTDECDGDEVCQGGLCTPGTALNCDDLNPCTADTCNATFGCVNTPLLNGIPCSDGNICNGAETCQSGLCTAGQALNCNDNNACTTDSCLPAACSSDIHCNDSNPCTTDVCTAGVCSSTPVSNGTPCLDANLCNGAESCQFGACTAGTALNCNDGNVCTTDSCTPATGCANTAASNGTACTDGNACNGAETCQAGTCTPAAPLNCDDGNACTTDSCNPVSGCSHTYIAACQTCTVNLNCNDANPCTTDVCNSGQCLNVAVADGTACSDGSLCNGIETCVAAACTPGTPLDCNDGNVCTFDTCNPATGCANVAAGNGVSCADGNVCNGNEICQLGVCTAPTPLSCDDGNSCTTDSCNALSGCVHTRVAGCQGGCVNASPNPTCVPCRFNSDCNDTNRCTGDTCPDGTCHFDPVPNATPCADSTVCNGDETCQAGACIPGTALLCNDGDACTADSCDNVVGCVTTPHVNGTPCPDATLCNGNETCINVVCTPGTPLDCNDNNLCTVDTCDPLLGCISQLLPDGASCADSDLCNGQETCVAGACTPGIPLVCDDLDVCTDNGCNPLTGCVFPFNTAPCDDMLFCTVGEACNQGVCGGGIPRDCTILNNSCNSGSCNEAAGACEATPTNNGGQCFSGAPCVENEMCSSGVCGGGSPLDPVTCFSPRIYVVNSFDDSLGILRSAGFVLEGTVGVGTFPADVAIDSAATRAYVSNNIDDTITALDLTDFSTLATIPVGRSPIGIGITPDGSRVYVANFRDDSVSVIDAATNTVITTVFIDPEYDPLAPPPPSAPARYGPNHIAVTRGGEFAYVTNNLNHTITVIRVSDNLIVRDIPVGRRPQGIAESPDGLFMYVAQTGDDNVAVIRIFDNAVIGLIPVGAEPTDVTFTGDGQFAYTSDTVSGKISKIRTSGVPRVVRTITVGDSPAGIIATPNGGMVAVANTLSNTVSFVDVNTDKEIAEIPVGIGPFGMATRPQPVFALAGAVNPTPVQPGDQVTMTLTYANRGLRTASGTVLSATIPPFTTFVSATGGGTAGGGQVQWNLGDLVGGAAGQVSFVLAVDPPPVPVNTQLVSTATLSDAELVTTTQNITADVDSDPQYSLAKVDDVDPVAAGGTLTYTITYANNAAAMADGEGVTITERYDPNVTFVSATPPPAAGTNNQWVIGALPIGASGSISVTVAVRSPLPNGTLLRNDATLSDAFGTVLTATQNTVVQSSPVFALNMVDSQDPLAAGSVVSYVVDYSNIGNENSTNVTLSAVYDPNLTFMSAVPAPKSGTNNTWTFNKLNVGTSGSITITGRVPDVLPNGTLLTNQVTMSNGGSGFASAAHTTTVSSAPVLSVFVADGPDPIATGGTLTYTITYANTGTDAAAGTSVVATYDAGTAFISATPPPTVGNNQWNVGTVPAGSTGTITITLQVTSPLGSTAAGQVEITDSIGTTASTNVSTTVAIIPVLALSVNDQTEPVAAGSTQTFIARYGNLGNSPATSTRMTLTYDPNVTFVSAVPPPDAGFNNRWTIGTLGAGISRDVLVTLRVNTGVADGTLLTTQGSLTATGGLLANASDTTMVNSDPSLVIAKSDHRDPTPAGQTVTYTITYTNSGGSDTTGVVVRETYDPRVTFVSAVPTPDPGTKDRWTIGDLPSGASGTIEVTVSVPAGLGTGSILTNQVSVTDAAARTANATERTTIGTPIFSTAVADTADPVASTQLVQYTINYQNLTASLQGGISVTGQYDARFVFAEAIPGPNPGTNNVWTIGSLTAGQSGSIVVRGFYTGEDGDTLVMRARISNAAGNAFGSETTTVDVDPTLDAPRIRLKQSPMGRDSWRASGRFSAPGLDPMNQALSVVIVGPGNIQHTVPLMISQLSVTPRGVFTYVGTPPGIGTVRVSLRRVGSGSEFRVRARVRGVDILAPFSTESEFRAIVRVGSHVAMSEPGEFRDVPNTRIFP
jgi:uncharacterized repeat protein (TIGR01451 family)